MSDGIVRICNLHGHELRLIGAHYVCPHGHECDLEWHVAGPGRKDDSDRPQLPAPVIELTYEKETPMPMKRQIKPHGTAARYWQGCRCQPCKTAVNEHLKAKKRRAAGEASTPARRARKVEKVLSPVVDSAAALDVTPDDVRDLSARILDLRRDLGEAEERFAHAVNQLLPDLKVVPRAVYELLKAGQEEPR